MSISHSLEDRIRFKGFKIMGNDLIIRTQAGKTLTRNKSCYPYLKDVPASKLSRFEILGDGEGVHWPLIDEDLSAAYLIYPEKFRVKAAKQAVLSRP